MRIQLSTVWAALVLLMIQNVKSSTVTLDFDDLKPKPPVYWPIFQPPDPYNLLHFTAFYVFEPASPRLDDLITEDDRNCAVSRPNALLGSRSGGREGLKPSFQIAPAHRHNTSFDLHALTMKPMSAPPGNEETTIWLQGRPFSADESDGQMADQLLWHVDIPVGYHLPFPVKMPVEWNHLQEIEMWAQYGPDDLDWEFCIDDVELRFRSEKDNRQPQVEL